MGSDTCMECPQGTFQDQSGEQCPIGYHRNSETNDCDECPHGTYTDTVESATCTPCAQGYFNPIRRQRKCLQCPSKHWTKGTGAIQQTDCIGPILIACDEENMTGNCQTFTDVSNRIPIQVKSLEVKAGQFKLYSSISFQGSSVTLKYPFKSDKIGSQDPLKVAPRSLVSDIDDSFCYENRGAEYQPSRFYNVTASGAACKNWKETKFSSFGDHSYCGNPDEKTKVEPWCYTHDPEKPWEYCSVPKCVWDFECYTGNGYEYRGTIARTENGYNCQNWLSDFPHPHVSCQVLPTDRALRLNKTTCKVTIMVLVSATTTTAETPLTTKRLHGVLLLTSSSDGTTLPRLNAIERSTPSTELKEREQRYILRDQTERLIVDIGQLAYLGGGFGMREFSLGTVLSEHWPDPILISAEHARTVVRALAGTVCYV
eukprot:sb/3464937/